MHVHIQVRTLTNICNLDQKYMKPNPKQALCIIRIRTMHRHKAKYSDLLEVKLTMLLKHMDYVTITIYVSELCALMACRLYMCAC